MSYFDFKGLWKFVIFVACAIALIAGLIGVILWSLSESVSWLADVPSALKVKYGESAPNTPNPTSGQPFVLIGQIKQKEPQP